MLLDPMDLHHQNGYNPNCAMINQDTTNMMIQLNNYYMRKVEARRIIIVQTIREICGMVQEILKEVENQEPRFISTLIESDDYWEGLYVHGPNNFEISLYLNQMGVFNFVDDGQIPGCAVLKLSDALLSTLPNWAKQISKIQTGRKRSMSLWVEFITASGYLSARKIRARFQTLVSQAVEKSAYKDVVKVLSDGSEVKLCIKEKYIVQLTPAFRCAGIWPRSASHWPSTPQQWPNALMISEIKSDGFTLHATESVYMRDKATGSEGDAWYMSFADPENKIIHGCARKRCLRILKCLRDSHLDLPGNPIENCHIQTLLLFELEKHPHDSHWIDNVISDRINGILLQLISCLQNRRCPHYFLPNVDLFKNKTIASMDQAAKRVWSLIRELLSNPRALEVL